MYTVLRATRTELTPPQAGYRVKTLLLGSKLDQQRDLAHSGRPRQRTAPHGSAHKATALLTAARGALPLRKQSTSSGAAGEGRTTTPVRPRDQRCLWRRSDRPLHPAEKFTTPTPRRRQRLTAVTVTDDRIVTAPLHRWQHWSAGSAAESNTVADFVSHF